METPETLRVARVEALEDPPPWRAPLKQPFKATQNKLYTDNSHVPNSSHLKQEFLHPQNRSSRGLGCGEWRKD
jgi:hypothetical protein